MAVDANYIDKTQSEFENSQQKNDFIIELITGQNKKLDSFIDSYDDIGKRLDETITNLELNAKIIDQLIKSLLEPQHFTEDTISKDLIGKIKNIVSEAENDISKISLASQKQIQSYTDQSRVRRDIYERTRKKDRLIMKINIGIIAINLIIILGVIFFKIII